METRVISVRLHGSTKKTDAEFERVISQMTAQGWTLVHNSRIGAAGGTLTFQRERPQPGVPMGEKETKVINVPLRWSTKKTDAEFERVISQMTAHGWTLVHNSRVGSAGGALTFQRERPQR